MNKSSKKEPTLQGDLALIADNYSMIMPTNAELKWLLGRIEIEMEWGEDVHGTEDMATMGSLKKKVERLIKRRAAAIKAYIKEQTKTEKKRVAKEAARDKKKR